MENIEIWKDIPEYEGLYQVSNMGRVKSLNYKRSGKERILKTNKNNTEYLNIVLHKNGKGKFFTVHKLVALVFLKNPENLPIINHKDENPSNNHVDNLEWCTYRYNNNYGTRNEKLRKSKKGKPLTEETRQKMCKAQYKHRKPILQYTKKGEFIREWDSAKSASQELKIYANNITDCCKGKLKTAYGFIWRYK